MNAAAFMRCKSKSDTADRRREDKNSVDTSQSTEKQFREAQEPSEQKEMLT